MCERPVYLLVSGNQQPDTSVLAEIEGVTEEDGLQLRKAVSISAAMDCLNSAKILHSPPECHEDSRPQVVLRW